MGFKIKKTVNGETVWEPIKAKKYTASKITEHTGALPITINANGQPLLDYKIYGNTEQTGTPTPENPIIPSGCGERTENVMPAGEQKTVVSNGVTFSSDGKGKYTINGTATTYASAHFNLLSAFTTPISVSNGGQGTLSFFNTSADYDVSFIFCNGATNVDDWRLYQIGRTSTAYNAIGNKYVDSVIIRVGSGVTVDMTITPEFTNDGIIHSEFEPYGYKIPISSANTTTPVYLGEVETTRRIKKLVLTGEEPWNVYQTSYYITVNNYYKAYDVGSHLSACSHYPNAQTSSLPEKHYGLGGLVDGQTYTRWNGNIVFNPSPMISSKTDWISYLAAQYAAGTPVTVWYVLAEPETGIVNEPLMKIGDYVDTVSMEQAGVSIPTNSGTTVIDYDGTLKPSQMYVKYNSWSGWSDIDDYKMVNGDWTQEMT